MFLKCLKKLYIFLCNYKHRINWYSHYKRITIFNKKINKIDTNKFIFNRVLIIVPHADDELIGCYNLIKDNNEKIKLFYCGYTGSNEDEVNKLIRLSEFKNVCQDLNIPYTVASYSIKEDLENEINNYLPELIMVPSYLDWHKEHRKINHLLKKIIENKMSPCIGLYKISVPIPSEQINYVISMTKETQENKWKLFSKYYISQRNLPIKRFKYEECIYGSFYNSFAAEVYCILNINDWKIMLDIVKNSEFENMLNDIKFVINNINKKYTRIDKLYKALIWEKEVKYNENEKSRINNIS